MIQNLQFLNPFTVSNEMIDNEDINLVYSNTFIVLFFSIINFVRTLNLLNITYNNSLLQNLHISNWFTNVSNIENLFLTSYNCFLSSGMVLNLTDTYNNNLNSRFVSWNLFILIFNNIFTNPTIVWFNNIFGQNLNLLEFMLYNDVNIFWCFISIFYLNFTSNNSTPRRINNWVQRNINRNRIDVW